MKTHLTSIYTEITHIDDFCFSCPNSFCTSYNANRFEVLKNIYNKLYQAVSKRVENTEREIACLLSGGLDSSIIAALVKKNI